MRLIFKIILAMGIVAGPVFLALYLFGFVNFLIFSYNFITAID